MSPFGPYANHADCVARNGDKANPHAYCAWLQHQITGSWPAELQGMPTDAWTLFREPYGSSLDNSGEKPVTEAEKEANGLALAALKDAGWLFARIGWVKQYAAPKMSTVANVRVFSTGTWTDSQGVEREWTEADLDDLVKAFTAGYPGTVPLKAGHTPDTFNTKIAEKLGVPVELITGDIGGKGQVALGRMATLERRGNLLFATFERVPEPIAALIEAGLFSTVSVEVERSESGDFHSALTAVAMLGAEEPAVDEATLDRALVFGGKRDGAVVLTFQTSDVPIEVLETEFKTLKDRMGESIKGMRGAPVFRAMLANLGTLFDQLKRGRHQTPEDQKGGPKMENPIATRVAMTADAIRALTIRELADKFQQGDTPPTVGALIKAFQQDGSLLALATALGLGEGATIEDILAAIEALKAKAGAAPPGKEVPPGEASAFQKVTSDLQKATARIDTLEHEKRVTDWSKRTSLLQSIPGKTEELAGELAEMEEKQSKEKAEAHFERLKTVNQTAFEANKVRGVSLPGEKRADFEKEVTEYQKANTKATRADALKAVMTANPTLYREYQAEEKATAGAE